MSFIKKERLLKIQNGIRPYKFVIYSYLIVMIVALLCCRYIANFIVINTQSIPYKVCLHLLRVKPEKNDLCVIQFRGKLWIKYLKGVEGDLVQTKDDFVFVNNEKIGKALRVHNLHAIKSLIIPEGYVFIAGTHKESLDSRYMEVGLIPVSAIKGKAIGLMKWLDFGF